MTFKKTEEHAYKLNEIAKHGASVLINVNSVENGKADVEIVFSPAGELRDSNDMPLGEQAINALAKSLTEIVKSRFPDMHGEATNLAAIANPELIEPLTGKTKEEFVQSGDFIPNLMGALITALGATNKAECGCEECCKRREAQEALSKLNEGEGNSPEPKNDTTD